MSFFILLFLPLSVRAQIDPSSALLLNGGKSPDVRDSGLDSGRYTVKPRERAERKDPPRKVLQQPDEEVPVYEPPPKVEPKEISAAQPITVVAPSPTPSPTSYDFRPHPRDPQPRDYEPEESLVDERKFNVLELGVAPSYFYNSSVSSFWYRSYNTSGPAVNVEAQAWLDPSFGVHAGYLSSLGGYVNDATDHSKNVTVSQTWLDLGLRFRRFFGSTPASPIVVFGADFHEYQFIVSSDATKRQKLRTTGILLSVEGELPRHRKYASTLGFQFMPKAQHKESATGTDVQSGSEADTNMVGISIGGKWRMDRVNTVFWKLSHSVERNLFSGTATAADPISGSTPSGVPVTNSFTILQFGFTWGN